MNLKDHKLTTLVNFISKAYEINKFLDPLDLKTNGPFWISLV